MILGRDDEASAQAYFDADPDQTIWLRIAWADGGGRFAALERDGRLVAMAAHDRQYLVQLHGAQALPDLARECLCPGEPIVGVAGAPELVDAALAALDLSERPVIRTSHEIIMSLDLENLVVPEMYSRPGVVVHRARPEDLPLLLEWRARYLAEVHGAPPDEASVDEVRRDQAEGRMWLLEEHGVPLNTVCFSAVFPRLLQIEYASSPPEVRAKSYGRATVAGGLLAMRAEGVTRAVLNTDRDNKGAQYGVLPLGFRKTADYKVVVLG